jgi:hypothetical protein
LNGKEKELPLDALAAGPPALATGNTTADVIKKHDRLNPDHSRRKGSAGEKEKGKALGGGCQWQWGLVL